MKIFTKMITIKTFVLQRMNVDHRKNSFLFAKPARYDYIMVTM